MSKKVLIFVSVTSLVVVAVGVALLIYFLVTAPDPFITEILKGEGIGDVEFQAAFTKMDNSGDMFWWFYPSLAENPTQRPVLLWLDGLTGLPPSLLANFGMFGPYDFNFTRREDSWVDEYNLLFIDAPLGTGFSQVMDDSQYPSTIEENANDVVLTLRSFYNVNHQYRDAPLYIFGEGHGGQLALDVAIRVYETSSLNYNLRGIAIGNGIISPALALTKLGFYLEELGYIDENGRDAIENLSEDINGLVSEGDLENAFELFTTLGEFVNENAGAVAVNLGHIVEKLSNDTAVTADIFSKKKYLSDVYNLDIDLKQFMEEKIAPALGIGESFSYDAGREAAIESFKNYFMLPATEKVEYILQNTVLEVNIYNGNLDAVSNTPGQLEWVDNLEWEGQDEFRASVRQTLIFNNLVEGYYREGARLHFYWMNVAGQSVPMDSPVAMKAVLARITS